MFFVTKEFKFDACHRLMCGYQGKCNNLHGHQWKVLITIKGQKLDQFGMVIDFNDLKEINEWIDSTLDHACLVGYGDEQMIKWLQENNQKMFGMCGNPTCENLAKIIYEFWKHKYDISKVEVFETPTSKAVYVPDK